MYTLEYGLNYTVTLFGSEAFISILFVVQKNSLMSTRQTMMRRQ